MDIEELKCPNCKTLIDVTGAIVGELVYCESCDIDLDYTGTELFEEE